VSRRTMVEIDVRHRLSPQTIPIDIGDGTTRSRGVRTANLASRPDKRLAPANTIFQCYNVEILVGYCSLICSFLGALSTKFHKRGCHPERCDFVTSNISGGSRN
jgi:hypothetical protein